MFPTYNGEMDANEIRARLAEGSRRAIAKGQPAWPGFGKPPIQRKQGDDEQAALLADVARVCIDRMRLDGRLYVARYLTWVLGGSTGPEPKP